MQQVLPLLCATYDITIAIVGFIVPKWIYQVYSGKNLNKSILALVDPNGDGATSEDEIKNAEEEYY